MIKKGIKMEQENLKGTIEAILFAAGREVSSKELSLTLEKSKDEIQFYKVNIEIDGDLKELTCISMGNPHSIVFTKDVRRLNIEKYGPIIEVDSHFPNKINVEFIEIIDKHNIKMRVWERGTGETLACGTGACASVVASVLNGYTERNVTVELLGGKLDIEWNKEDNHVYMTGPAKTVFEGQLDENNI